jgi:transposase
VVHAASIQDRDGAALVLDRRTRALFSFLLAIFADAGYQGPRAAAAARGSGGWRLRLVRRAEAACGFVVLPKRWIVERTLSWLIPFPSDQNRCAQSRMPMDMMRQG